MKSVRILSQTSDGGGGAASPSPESGKPNRRRNRRWRWARSGVAESERADGALRTEAMRKLVDRHPRTGNHVLFFPSALAPEARAALAGIPSEDLPNDRRFGDGSAVPDEAVAALRDA